MKIELEKEDIRTIAREVVEMIKPLLKRIEKGNGNERILDVPGLADYIGVDESWVYKQVSNNSLPYFKAGRYVRFRKNQIDDWMDSQSVKPYSNLSAVKGLKSN